MAKAMAVPAKARTIYDLEGTLLEACSCGILCPCWVGEDPDGGECYSVNAYHFTRGEVDGVDVSGQDFVTVNRIPGNVLTPKSWKVVLFTDTRASEAQRQAILAAYRGDLGGPLADLAGLVGAVLGVETATIRHEVSAGTGTLAIPGIVEAVMQPYRSPDGASITTLRDSLFSTVPGSPAYVGKASRYRVHLPQYGMSWEYQGRNAIQSDYHITFTS